MSFRPRIRYRPTTAEKLAANKEDEPKFFSITRPPMSTRHDSLFDERKKSGTSEDGEKKDKSKKGKKESISLKNKPKLEREPDIKESRREAVANESEHRLMCERVVVARVLKNSGIEDGLADITGYTGFH